MSPAPDDYYSGIAAWDMWPPSRWVPPPLEFVAPDAMLAVLHVRGPEPWQWREVAAGAFIAWPHAAGAAYAWEMTAGQLRDCLAERDAR